MQPETQQFLYDIWQATERLAHFGAGKSLSEYLADDLLRSAVERQFITIGEALSRLLQADAKLEASISDSKRVIAFRNILVHGYAKISNEDVWRILQNHVPVLRREIDALFKPPPGRE